MCQEKAMNISADTPYELAVGTVRERNDIRSKIQHARRQAIVEIEVGDRIVYDPYNPLGVSPSWRARIGKKATVTKKGDRYSKLFCIFDGENSELRPSSGNIYVENKWFRNFSWEL